MVSHCMHVITYPFHRWWAAETLWVLSIIHEGNIFAHAFGGHLCALLLQWNCWVTGCVRSSFSRNHPMIFRSDCTNFHLHRQRVRVPTSPRPWQHLPLIMPFLKSEFSYFPSICRRVGGRGKQGVLSQFFLYLRWSWDFVGPVPYRFSICRSVASLR